MLKRTKEKSGVWGVQAIYANLIWCLDPSGFESIGKLERQAKSLSTFNNTSLIYLQKVHE